MLTWGSFKSLWLYTKKFEVMQRDILLMVEDIEKLFQKLVFLQIYEEFSILVIFKSI